MTRHKFATLHRRAATITVTTAAALAAVGVSDATRAIPGSDGTINACYGSSGEIRVFDKEAGKTCSKGWTPLSWNQQVHRASPASMVRTARRASPARVARATSTPDSRTSSKPAERCGGLHSCAGSGPGTR